MVENIVEGGIVLVLDICLDLLLYVLGRVESVLEGAEYNGMTELKTVVLRDSLHTLKRGVYNL